MNKIRLNKYLSSAGISSRRKADDLIVSGRVLVNNCVAKVGEVINSDIDEILVDRKKITANVKKHYFAFYKPKGIITSLTDKQGIGIKKFLPKNLSIFPVGRLDKYSEGLLILTDDGDFAQEISDPKKEKEKIYHLTFSGKPNRIGKEGIIRIFQNGIRHRGEIYKAKSVKFIENNLIEIILTEGKNRQIRIITGKIGLSIEKLIRVKIGKLSLFDLKLSPGKIVKINKSDII
ncbi:MAG: 23S rRNA pseudouridine synthase [Candidatus Berkelbacteria bacterium Athens1014_28]|uniref:23S rRNA pseudouridine synthase n=1 Tax=Candidatus Berkelbacteria bacterium Athens1014_28 TaxID=2017145 RepID=A0A554LR31_9BACT|nr:MAG: 23S rRNA pseudouridine synthase [Candidatus Berkelbacteria bacterium Athens1014_28]